MVMSVDCTHLLNLRHVEDKDNLWLTTYDSSSSSSGGSGEYSFDQVRAARVGRVHTCARYFIYRPLFRRRACTRVCFVVRGNDNA